MTSSNSLSTRIVDQCNARDRSAIMAGPFIVLFLDMGDALIRQDKKAVAYIAEDATPEEVRVLLIDCIDAAKQEADNSLRLAQEAHQSAINALDSLVP
jgi:hypothetical protein